jgi:hypothetical protein
VPRHRQHIGREPFDDRAGVQQEARGGLAAVFGTEKVRKGAQSASLGDAVALTSIGTSLPRLDHNIHLFAEGRTPAPQFRPGNAGVAPCQKILQHQIVESAAAALRLPCGRMG